ncbi:MAG: autotransporter outer membrane beta-barrel domain-containing protein [Planctomycetes bacterium]|nr:autotransporter outer membrane beta-barrel domain-containing protein [Planctomycetota bacterium]
MRKLACASAVLALVCFTASAVDFNPYSFQNNSEILVSGLQRWATAKNGDGLTDKTKYTSTASAVAYKYNTPMWSAGMSMSYEWGNSKNNFDLGAGDSDYLRIKDRTLGFTLFGEVRNPTGWYGKGSAYVGFADQKLKNGRYDIGGATGGYGRAGSDHSTRWAASVEMGKVFDFGAVLRLTPHAGFDYAYQPSTSIGFTSTDFGRENFNTRSQNYYQFPIGVTFAKDFVNCDWVITPSIDLTFVPTVGHMKTSSINYHSGFSSFNVSEWKTYGVGAGHYGGRVTAGVTAVKTDKFDLGLNYSYEGRKKYDDHRITAGFGVRF